MGTTGTIGQTQFNNRLIIDHAYRACRKLPQLISGEQIQAALDQLGLMLSGLANEGTPLWCQTKYIFPLVQGQPKLDLSQYLSGGIDILDANLQQCTQFTGTPSASQGVAANAFDGNLSTACVQTNPAGNITLQLASAQAIANVGIMPNVTATWNISLQYSQDGITWTTFYTNAAFQATAGLFSWLDFSTFGVPVPALYFRLQANSTTVLNVTELFFGNNPLEIPVSRINKDDYWTLPNKLFQGRPVQYWCDRQVNGPVMYLWPAPGAQFVFQMITALVHRHIMDVGQMTNTIEVPQRTFDFVMLSLAERIRLVDPDIDKDATQDVPMMAAKARKLFWGEERDDSPIHLAIDISPYTA